METTTRRNIIKYVNDIELDPEIGGKRPDLKLTDEVIEHTKIQKPATLDDVRIRVKHEAEQLAGVNDRMRTVLFEIDKNSPFNVDDAKKLATEFEIQGWPVDKIVVARENEIIEITNGVVKVTR